jgi:hypothetical protein
MGACARSKASRRAERAEIALQVLGDAFLVCGDAFRALFAFLTLFGCLDLVGYLDLFRCLDFCGCRAACNNYCQ